MRIENCQLGIERTAPCALSRRRFLGACALGTLGLTAPSILVGQTSKPLPIAEAFDRQVESFMAKRKVPGGALAVVKNGRLVYARGYGWADREKKIPAKPDLLFRIASLSKPITAVAILKLIEERKLDLEARAFDIVRRKPVLPAGKKQDPRLEKITIRQLLQHTGGWDRNKSFDPMFRSSLIAEKAGVPAPAGAEDIIRYMLGRPLDFAPGTRYAYSNFGYCVLGRVIEEISGQGYEGFVQEKVLAPIGAKRMRIGASLSGEQADREVRYYMAGNSVADSVFKGKPKKLPWPYGGFHLEAMDAHGGWIASALDLARFAAALHEPEHSPLLERSTFELMYAPPPPPVWRKPNGTLEDAYYGCGWMVRPVGPDGKASYWHTGSLPGTATLLVRRWDGLSWAVLFNQRSDDRKRSDSAIDSALHRAADAVADWPSENLFTHSGWD